MPHIIIESSDNISNIVKDKKILELAHQALAGTALVDPNNIKSRSYSAEDFLVGTKGRNAGFMHVRVYILQGRTEEQKSKISDAILESLSTSLANDIDELTVDVIEMDKSAYRKYRKMPDSL